MIDTIYIGSSPYEEDCAQTTQADYLQKARLELSLYKKQLLALFPPPHCAILKIKWQSHDFGYYGEVVAVFDPFDPKQEEWAYKVEDGCATWDEHSKQELEAYNKSKAVSIHL